MRAWHNQSHVRWYCRYPLVFVPQGIVTDPTSLFTRDGIVNLTADTRFPVIFLDTHVQKYKELADRQSSVLPIYWGFSQ